MSTKVIEEIIDRLEKIVKEFESLSVLSQQEVIVNKHFKTFDGWPQRALEYVKDFTLSSAKSNLIYQKKMIQLDEERAILAYEISYERSQLESLSIREGESNKDYAERLVFSMTDEDLKKAFGDDNRAIEKYKKIRDKAKKQKH